MDAETSHPGLDRIADWFRLRHWQPFDFQREVWQAWLAGESGLLHAPTGAGKTLAVLLGPLAEATLDAVPKPGLRLLWLTPMRALAHDTARALGTAMAGMAVPWRIGVRTGDTTASVRTRQDRSPPQLLVTTPESLCLMLSQSTRAAALEGLAGVVVDEWHELLGSKRGVQVELALAWLRTRNPRLRIWGMSATLGNLEEACATLLGGTGGRLVQGRQAKRLHVGSQIPQNVERFPWGGHLGMAQLDAVIRRIEAAPGTLVFTNTRSQAELWYQAMLERRPDWAGRIALHHGSIDRSVRTWVENALRDGALHCVVCTSSLDLGVDFSPVSQVLQIGSPKGVARLVQRAGRSGHAPGQESRILCVPTHAFELLEAAAARLAVQDGRVEARQPLVAPLDVLLQHLVTLAAGPGFRPRALLAEVRGTRAYAGLADATWEWALDFVRHGGHALHAYPEFRKVVERDGLWRVAEPQVARRHRMGIGTITADSAVDVRFLRGGRLGSVEESFIARLRKGDCFLFAGRHLELVRVDGMTALVRLAGSRRANVPRWQGGRMPFSGELATGVRALLDLAARLHSTQEVRIEPGHVPPEVLALDPILRLQAKWSVIPAQDALLAETLRLRDGHYFFLFPFEGRHVHGALAAWLAWRLSRRQPASYSLAWNDFGLVLVSPQPIGLDESGLRALLDCPDEGTLARELLASVNAAEMTRRQFREVARVAGLVFQGFPGAGKSVRQLQVSSSLLHDVFARFDPDNLLLRQAEGEVLRQEMELPRLFAFLRGLPARTLLLREPPQLTPFAFPLAVERLRERVSSEALAARVARMQLRLERAANEG